MVVVVVVEGGGSREMVGGRGLLLSQRSVLTLISVSIRSTPSLSQYHLKKKKKKKKGKKKKKESGHSAKSAGGWLQLNTHVPHVRAFSMK